MDGFQILNAPFQSVLTDDPSLTEKGLKKLCLNSLRSQRPRGSLRCRRVAAIEFSPAFQGREELPAVDTRRVSDD